jgi:hypothetical protein
MHRVAAEVMDVETVKTDASILGPLIGLAGVIAGFLYFRASQRHMELSYGVFPPLILARVRSPIRDKVRILYNNEPIEDLSNVLVEIRNSGTEPVEFNWSPDTLETPVTLDFAGARILGDPIVETTGSDLKPPATAIKDQEHASRVVVNNMFLNPGQDFTVSTFLTGYLGYAKVYANLNGLRDLKGRIEAEVDDALREALRRRIAIVLVFTLIFVVVTTFAYIWWLAAPGAAKTNIPVWVSTLLTPLVGLIGAIIGFYYGGQTAVSAASQAATSATQTATQTAAQVAAEASQAVRQEYPGDS